MVIAIVSGYFYPIHEGHKDMILEAKKLADKLIVIVNNDVQQMEKFGEIKLSEKKRRNGVKKLPGVDDVVISIDKDPSVKETLRMLAKKYNKDKLIFCNGGTKESSLDIPETEVCREFNIELKFGIGEKLENNDFGSLLY